MDLGLLFFFFKQKTAYEMRISDWSSDVCSSDLDAALSHGTPRRDRTLPRDDRQAVRGEHERFPDDQRPRLQGPCAGDHRRRGQDRRDRGNASGARNLGDADAARSEEHTPDLQTLMRVSYAVFRSNKK